MVRPEHVTDQEKPSAQECCWHSMPSAHTLADLTPSHLHFSEDSWKVLGLLSGQVQHQLWYLFLKIFPLLIIPPDNICIEVLSPVCESCQKKAVSDRDEMFDCETDYPAAWNRIMLLGIESASKAKSNWGNLQAWMLTWIHFLIASCFWWVRERELSKSVAALYACGYSVSGATEYALTTGQWDHHRILWAGREP